MCHKTSTLKTNCVSKAKVFLSLSFVWNRCGEKLCLSPLQKLDEQIFVRGKKVSNHLVCGHDIFHRDSVLIAWGEEMVLFTPKLLQFEPHWQNWQAETQNFFLLVCITSPHKLIFLQCWRRVLVLSLMAVSKGLVGILKHSRVQSCLLKWALGIRMIQNSLVQGLLWLTTYEEMKHISAYSQTNSLFFSLICLCQNKKSKLCTVTFFQATNIYMYFWYL